MVFTREEYGARGEEAAKSQEVALKNEDGAKSQEVKVLRCLGVLLMPGGAISA